MNDVTVDQFVVQECARSNIALHLRWLVSTVMNQRGGKPREAVSQSWKVSYMDDGRPLFIQIAELIEASILDGSLAEHEQAPSTNELAAFHRVNPATAGKGLSLLVDRGILERRRGLGTFVAENAQQMIRDERVQQFARHYIDPLLAEARAIGLEKPAVLEIIRNRDVS